MSSNRSLNVFWRYNGSVLFEDTLESAPGSRTSWTGPAQALDLSVSAGPLHKPIPADVTWSLVQVFIQFAREVDGGNVRRLVFRNPSPPASERLVFGSREAGAVAGAAKAPPVVIFVAHDDLFVVTVTERCSPDASQLKPSRNGDALAGCAGGVLRLMAKEQAEFTKIAAQAAAAEGVGGGVGAAIRGALGGGTAAAAALRVDGGRSPSVEAESYVSGSSSSVSYGSQSGSFSEGTSTGSDEGRNPTEPEVELMPMTNAIISQIGRVIGSMAAT